MYLFIFKHLPVSFNNICVTNAGRRGCWWMVLHKEDNYFVLWACISFIATQQLGYYPQLWKGFANPCRTTITAVKSNFRKNLKNTFWINLLQILYITDCYVHTVIWWKIKKPSVTSARTMLPIGVVCCWSVCLLSGFPCRLRLCPVVPTPWAAYSSHNRNLLIITMAFHTYLLS
jgi:hypothetical protein